jgi:protein-disulfide isomerase
MHPVAFSAAAAALCADEQDKFWQMRDRLFAEPITSERDLTVSAEQAGLDLEMYDACRASMASAKLVEQDISEARALGITATPTFLFGRLDAEGRLIAEDVIVGTSPIANFRAILDRLLK